MNDASIAPEDAFRLHVTIQWMEHYLLLEEGSLCGCAFLSPVGRSAVGKELASARIKHFEQRWRELEILLLLFLVWGIVFSPVPYD